MVQNRFRSGIRRARTRTFPGADVGSDHDLVLLNFRVRLKKIKKPQTIRMKFNLDRLKDPTILESFQATVGGKFAALLTLEEEAEEMTSKFNTVMTETAGDILGKHRQKKQPWTTDEILEMCDTRRVLKEKKHTTTGEEAYRDINNKIKQGMRDAREDWIQRQCTVIEENLSKNRSKKAFQTVKELTQQKQSRVSTIQDKEGNCLTGR